MYKASYFISYMMNPENVKKLIENAGRAKRKSASDIKIINDTIKEGCPNWQLRPKIPTKIYSQLNPNTI